MIDFIWYFDKKNVCNFLLRDLHENVISFKDILIKRAFPIDFNVKLKLDKSITNKNSENS
jgi:hypothetical protein